MKPDTSKWRDASAYAFALKAASDSIAWEFLRRNQRYQEDIRDLGEGEAIASDVLQRWGLHFRSPA